MPTDPSTLLAAADEALSNARLKELSAHQALLNAEAALPQAPDLLAAAAQVREFRADYEDARTVTGILQARRDEAAKELVVAELALLREEEAAAFAAVEPAAQALALIVRDAAERIGAAWSEFGAARRLADQLGEQLRAQGQQPTRLDPHGLAAGVLSSERYVSVPHTSANLLPMASAAALVAWEKAAPAREAERAEQRRRAEAADQQARLHSPNPEVRATAQAELRAGLARFHGRAIIEPSTPVRSPNGIKMGSGLSADDAALVARLVAVEK